MINAYNQNRKWQLNGGGLARTVALGNFNEIAKKI